MWTVLPPFLFSHTFYSPAYIFLTVVREKRAKINLGCYGLCLGFFKLWEEEIKDQSEDLLDVLWFCLALGTFPCKPGSVGMWGDVSSRWGGTTQRLWCAAGPHPWSRETEGYWEGHGCSSSSTLQPWGAAAPVLGVPAGLLRHQAAALGAVEPGRCWAEAGRGKLSAYAQYPRKCSWQSSLWCHQPLCLG